MTSVFFWLAAIAAAAVLYSARYRVLRKIGRFLVVDDGQPSGDAIVILNGNISTRTYRAVDLYNRRRAPVLIARLADTEEVRIGVIPNISDATRELLRRRGVADDDIAVLVSDRWIAGTWPEAILLCDHIRRNGYRSVTIVTDAFHTRRARWTFRRVMGDECVVFTCAATSYSLALVDQWWRSEYGFVQVVVEYIKFLHYRRLARSARGDGPALEDLPPAAPVRQQVIGQDGDLRRRG
ncbi:MAG: YdcF family protein [Gammaproteobacteria bacterium]|nr:YdcF family protein [Gammaproteobacteria bacterium]